MEICLKIKSLENLGGGIEPKTHGEPNSPNIKSLLNMILMVADFLYYPKKMSQMKLLLVYLLYYLNT